jgi:selenophosphate synthetase-related protein
MNLPELTHELRGFPGIQRKGAIGRCLRAMEGAWGFGDVVLGPGDDAAVLQADVGGYLLLAADGIVPALLEQDPVRAGRAVVLVNANDIYAMGGRPLAMVNVLAGVDEEQIEAISQGIREECQRLQVPMVGGHISPEGTTPFLAASVLGKERALLTDRRARPGQAILLAVDLRGERWGDYLLNWDSHVRKDSDTLCQDLAILCGLAEAELCATAKDVSNAGILGSLAMILENAGLGAAVDLDRIEVPDSFEMLDWLKVYPSYGFLLVCDEEAESVARGRFEARGIWVNRIGRTDESSALRLSWKGEEDTLFDFSKSGIFDVPL